MVKILLMRHAESQWNAAQEPLTKVDESGNFIIPDEERIPKMRLLKGDRSLVNCVITEKGIKQTQSALENLKKYPNIKFVGSSPLRRCIQTMESLFENFKDVSDNSKIQVKIFKNAHEQFLSPGEISYWTQDMKNTLQYPDLYDLKFAEENLTWFEEILSEKKRAELHAEYGDETDPNKKIDII